MERRFVDASSVVDVFHKTLQQSRQVLTTIDANSQYFGPHEEMKRDIHNKDNEVLTSNLEPNIMDLTFVVLG